MPAIRTAGERSEGTRAPLRPRISTRASLDVIIILSSDDDDEIRRDHLAPPAKLARRRSSKGLTENIKPLSREGGGTTLPRPASKSSAKPITIKGTSLTPTIVFDTFWRFAAERKLIDDRRRSGQQKPWTNDVIMQKYAFCNTYRVLDKVSQYIIREVIEKGSQDPQELVFRITLFNLFTKIATWELLQRELGPLTWERYNRDDYLAVLTEAKMQGMKLYTGAFQKPAPHFGFSDAHSNHIFLLEVLMEADLPGRFMGARYMDQVYEYLVSFPSMGEFSTFQLLLNLQYSKLLNFSEMDFVVAGPGALSGLTKMFGDSFRRAKTRVPGIETDIIRWLAEHQDEHFERLGLEFSGLGPERLPMGLADIEHLLCEVDKYSRLAHPRFKGKRTELRITFKPSPGPVPRLPTIPEAWSHPERKVVRIRPGGPPVIEKRYTVNYIGAHRAGATGLEYKVFWTGYSDAEATWEPEASLMADAPVAVQEYLAKN